MTRVGRSDVRRMLADAGVQPSKARGQNFLVDPNVADRICRLADTTSDDVVLEIGVGVGSLTAALAQVGAHVVGVEIDPALADQARAALPASQVEIIVADATRLDWAQTLGADITKMVSNLPYSVGTHVLVDLLEVARQIRTFVVMVQREVAERLLARPGDKAYGSASVRVGYYTTARSGGRVAPTVFYPEPEVDSALVRLDRRRAPVDTDPTILFEVVDAGFAQRRKTIRNSLTSRWSAAVVDAALVRAELDPQRRAETMDVVEFAQVAGALAMVD